MPVKYLIPEGSFLILAEFTNNLTSYRMKLQEIGILIRKDLTSELRSKTIVISTLLYVLSTAFICYLSFRNLQIQTWNAMLWVVILFSLTNAANRVFTQDTGRQKIYLYTLASPQGIILSKIIYQWGISVLASLLVLITWLMLFSQSILHPFWFVTGIVLGTMAMSNIFTLNNALSAGTDNSPALLAILSFPILVPVIMITIAITRMALTDDGGSQLPLYAGLLALLNVLSLALSYILFPYLWRH